MSDDENVKITYTVNLPQLIKQLLKDERPDHNECDALRVTSLILHELAARASELNDDQLNGIMCRFALYDVSDPNYSGYNPGYTKKAINDGFKAKSEKITCGYCGLDPIDCAFCNSDIGLSDQGEFRYIKANSDKGLSND